MYEISLYQISSFTTFKISRLFTVKRKIHLQKQKSSSVQPFLHTKKKLKDLVKNVNKYFAIF